MGGAVRAAATARARTAAAAAGLVHALTGGERRTRCVPQSERGQCLSPAPVIVSTLPHCLHHMLAGMGMMDDGMMSVRMCVCMRAHVLLCLLVWFFLVLCEHARLCRGSHVRFLVFTLHTSCLHVRQSWLLNVPRLCVHPYLLCTCSPMPLVCYVFVHNPCCCPHSSKGAAVGPYLAAIKQQSWTTHGRVI